MGSKVGYKKQNVALRSQVAGLLAAQQAGQLGGNQNMGPTFYGFTQSATTDAGLSGPSGFQFGVASPDLPGYNDGNPFTSFSPNSTGNSPSTINQSQGGLNGAFGVTAGTPGLNAQPQNSMDAMQLQLQFDHNTTVQYAIYGAVGIGLIWLLLRYLKK